MKLFGSIKNLFKKNRKQAHQELVSEFNKIFGYQFNDTLLLLEALTHRSYIYANDHRLPSNERLEFLGDSILGLVIAEYLYKLHTDYDEGDLTKTKAILVNEITLARVGIESGLNDLILLSPRKKNPGVVSGCRLSPTPWKQLSERCILTAAWKQLPGLSMT